MCGWVIFKDRYRLSKNVNLFLFCKKRADEMADKKSSNKDVKSKILQPLSMNKFTDEISSKPKKSNTIPCLLCDERFPASENGAKNPVLAHLLSVHKLIIADVDKVSYFPKYIEFWKEKFSRCEEMTDYCVVINTNTKLQDKDPSEKFHMLTNFLPEDMEIRTQLKNQKLVNILDEQQSERIDRSFSRKCLFCKVMFHGNRALLFHHMAKDHAFNVGNPENIVRAVEFLDLMKSKLDSFECLFCEKEFKDWSTLKDHMRKKSHKRLDPNNKEYDKYYLINYLEPGKDWKEVQQEPEYEREISEENDEMNEKEWEDWVEDDSTLSLCLFCMKTSTDVYDILEHMKNDHKFDLTELKMKMELDFYDQVKIVNYIRKHVYQCRCPMCLREFRGKEQLQRHLQKEKHYCLPDDRSIWDQPGYFFSTFDDDSLLCHLEDDDKDKDVIEQDENQNIKVN